MSLTLAELGLVGDRPDVALVRSVRGAWPCRDVLTHVSSGMGSGWPPSTAEREAGRDRGRGPARDRGPADRGRDVRRAEHREDRDARRDLAHRVLLLLPRQARAAGPSDDRRQRAAHGCGRHWWSGGGDIREALAGIERAVPRARRAFRATVEVSTYDEEVASSGAASSGGSSTRPRSGSRPSRRPDAPCRATPARWLSRSCGWPSARCTSSTCRASRTTGDALVDALALIFSRSVYGDA